MRYQSLARECHLIKLCPTSQRHKLKAPLTPVTPESFAQWKKTRMDKKQAELEAKEKAKLTQRAAGRTNGMSGRDMFTFGEFEDDDEVSLNTNLIAFPGSNA